MLHNMATTDTTVDRVEVSDVTARTYILQMSKNPLKIPRLPWPNPYYNRDHLITYCRMDYLQRVTVQA